MILAIFLFVLIAVAHLVYERTVAPSLRLVAKFDLFAIRDEARALERQAETAEERVGAHFIQFLADEIMWDLRQINVFELVHRHLEVDDDEEAKAQLDEVRAFIDYEASPAVRDLYERCMEVIVKVAAVNTFMLMLYTFPFALAIHLARGPKRQAEDAETYPVRSRQALAVEMNQAHLSPAFA